MTTPAKLREQARGLINQAYQLERAEVRSHERFMIVEQIQDGRPRVSGPFTWDEAYKVVRENPNRTICDFGALLP